MSHGVHVSVLFLSIIQLPHKVQEPITICSPSPSIIHDLSQVQMKRIGCHIPDFYVLFLSPVCFRISV